MKNKGNKILWIIGVVIVILIVLPKLNPNIFSVILGSNLVSNPSMENANNINTTNPASWIVVSSDSKHLAILDNTIAHTGSKSLKMEVLNSTKSFYRWQGDNVNVEPNTWYYIEYWYKAENLPIKTGSDTITSQEYITNGYPTRAMFEWSEYDGIHSDRLSYGIKGVPISWTEGNTGWKKVSAYIKTSENTSYLSPRFFLYSFSGKIWFDDLVIKKATEVPEAATPSSDYWWPGIKGVGVHGGHYNDVAGMKELGISMIRDDLTWGGIERTKGVYNFSGYDTKVQKLADAGITPVFLLLYSNCLYNSMPYDYVPLPNTGIESWTNPYYYWTSSSAPSPAPSWTVQFFNGAAGYVSQSTDAHSGSYSLNVTNVNVTSLTSGPYIAVFYAEGQLKFKNDSNYTISVWLKGNALNLRTFVQESGGTWSAISPISAINLTDTWTQYSTTFTAKNLKVSGFRFTIDAIYSNQTVLIDNVEILENGQPMLQASQKYACDRYIPRDTTEFNAFKEAYGNYVYASVSHFKGKVKYFELWNEPNGFWEPVTNDQLMADQYIELMKEGYTRAKQANPDSIIVSAGIGVGDDLINRYIAHYYLNGAKNYFDILALHPYCPYEASFPPSDQGKTCTVIENMAKIKAIMDANGDSNKKIWITEFGYPTEGCYFGRSSSLNSTGFVSGCPSPVLSEENQAIRIKNIFPTLRDQYPYITAFFWYDYKDDCAADNTGGNIRRYDLIACANRSIILGTACPVDIECRFGLVRDDLTRKPAWYIYQNLSKHQCTIDKCEGTSYYQCINRVFTNQGQVPEHCGVPKISEELINITTNVTITTINTINNTWGKGATNKTIYIIEPAQLIEGYAQGLTKNDQLEFRVNEETHHLTVINLDNIKAVISISSLPQQTTISIGEEKTFDLTDDGIDDISVKLNSIDIASNTADLKIKSLQETTTNTSTIVVFVVIAIIITFFWLIMRNGKKHGK